MRRHFYGCCAITLGAWEALAFTTGSVPTVTEAVQRYRHLRAMQLAVLVWTSGLLLHFLR